MARQSDYSLNSTPDALDQVLLCENPVLDPTRSTKRATIPSLLGVATAVTGNATLNPGTIVLANNTSGNITLTVTEGHPDDSRFTVMKVSDDNYDVTITRSGSTETFSRLRVKGAAASSVKLIAQGECVSYIKDGDVWYAFGRDAERYQEVWSIPADTSLPTTQGTMTGLTFSYSPTGETSSLLFSNSSGVLTALGNFSATVDIQAVIWLDCQANNSTGFGMLVPVCSGSGLLNPIWASQGSPRTDMFPSSVSASGLIEVTTGQTFKIEGLVTTEAGTIAAQLGNTDTTTPTTPVADSYGALVTFTVG